MRYQDHSKYAESPAGRRFVTITDLRRGGYKVRQAEVYPGGDGNLSQEVEPIYFWSALEMKLVEGVALYQPVIQAKKGALCWGASM